MTSKPPRPSAVNKKMIWKKSWNKKPACRIRFRKSTVISPNDMKSYVDRGLTTHCFQKNRICSRACWGMRAGNHSIGENTSFRGAFMVAQLLEPKITELKYDMYYSHFPWTVIWFGRDPWLITEWRFVLRGMRLYWATKNWIRLWK